MAEVVQFTGATSLDIPPAKILDNAPRDMTEAMVVGRDANGELYVASSQGNIAESVLLLELAKLVLIGLFKDG